MERFNGLCGHIYGQEHAGKKLVVVVHGQGVAAGEPPRNPNWIKGWAEQLVKACGLCAIALYRPGYGDGDPANISQAGDTGDDHRDNLTRANMILVMGALGAIKQRFNPGRFGIYAHSGGGGVGFIAMGWKEAPHLVDRAVLSAPLGDITTWRGRWTRSLNPLDFANSTVVKGKRAYVFYGSEDDVVPFELVIPAVRAMRQRGGQVLMQRIQGDHVTPYFPTLPKQVLDAVDEMMKLAPP